MSFPWHLVMTSPRQLWLNHREKNLGLHYNSCKFLTENSCVQPHVYFMSDWKYQHLSLLAMNLWSWNGDFRVFLFEPKTLLYKDIVNFVQLFIFSVEKNLYLFDCLARFSLNRQMKFGLYSCFDWLFCLIWRISGELCLFESYFIKAIKHTFLWVYRDSKLLGMLGRRTTWKLFFFYPNLI